MQGDRDGEWGWEREREWGKGRRANKSWLLGPTAIPLVHQFFLKSLTLSQAGQTKNPI